MTGFVVVWLGFAVVTALAARGRGRSGLAWFLLGLVFGLFALIAVLVMAPVHPDAIGEAVQSVPHRPRGSASAPPKANPSTLEPLRLDQPTDDMFTVLVEGVARRQEVVRASVGGEVPKRAWATLEAEPQNPMDANAVRVRLGGNVVGYLPSETAKAIASQRGSMRDQIFKTSHPAWVVGGYTDDLGDTVPLGVRLMVRGV